ncbi:DUF4910 domain-containing protein [Pandoraea sp. NPDC087047]|uniref:DUF4910 domain-containing protein n=1 Tax=Pandoraea sp. NPDC087047 TaxID=3364390 RepID=UPI003816D811
MERVIRYLQSVDRYQGALTTYEACQEIATILREFNRDGEIHVRTYEAGSGKKYLGFDAPTPWTLLDGKLRASTASGKLVLSLQHEVQPLLVATNSCGFSGVAKLLEYCPDADIQNCIVLFRGDRSTFARIYEDVERRGAYGIVTDAFCKTIQDVEARGRIELPNDSTMFVCSITREEVSTLLDAMVEEPAEAKVQIEVENAGDISVLEYRNTGAHKSPAASEVWITAHICHPRPGANDNASGVAVAVELAHLLHQIELCGGETPSVRIIFAPEYVGLAAYLADCRERAGFVINIDTVGGDPDITGAPIELELPPPYLSSEYDEQLVATMIKLGPNFDGAREPVVIPFVGYSDHALFAASCINIPAVQFGQSSDPFNHTDLDLIKNISFPQLEWICSTILRFLTFNTAKPHEEEADEVSAMSVPFNIRSFLNCCSIEERMLISSDLQKNKKIYMFLQKIWLGMQRGINKKFFDEKDFEGIHELDSSEIERYVEIVRNVRNSLKV